MPRVAIANATPFARKDGQVLLPPDEWKSLMQWFSIFDRVTLLKPSVRAEAPCTGWMAVPAHVRAIELCKQDGSLLRRRTDTLRAARAGLHDVDLFYARMPNREALWCDRVACQANIPLLIELHGDWETAILHEDSQALARLATRRCRSAVANRSLQHMCARASWVVSIGPRLAEKYAPPGTPRLITTNHLLSAREYAERESFDLHHPPRILFVGAIQRRKGLHVLFESLRSLQLAGREFEMVLAGTGPQKASLANFAERHGFGPRVRFVGHVPHGVTLFELYRQADLFVLPSIAAEGVPRVTHEAMANGCPAVGTDVGSIAWQLREDAGVVIPPNNAQALTRALSNVLDSFELRRTLSMKGYQRSLEHTLEEQQLTLRRFVEQQLATEPTSVRSLRRTPPKGWSGRAHLTANMVGKGRS